MQCFWHLDNRLRYAFRKVGRCDFHICKRRIGGYNNSFELKIEGKGALEFSYSCEEIPGCCYPESFYDFDEGIYVGPENPMFSQIYINLAGTYQLTASYQLVDFPEVPNRIEVEFAIVY